MSRQRARERKAPETLTYEVPAPAKKKAKKKAAPAVKKGIAKKTGGKAKKEKKPYKNAMNAYMFFVADERKKIMAKKPDTPVTEVSKLAGAAWKKMADKDKKKYNDLAAKDKIRAAKDKAKHEKKK